MWPALPAPEYYGGSAPPAPSAGIAPIRPHLPRRETRRTGHGRFPCSLLSDRRVRHPALPLRPRHGYAAVLRHGLPPQAAKTRTGVPARNEGRARTATQPVSAGFELVPPQEA